MSDGCDNNIVSSGNLFDSFILAWWHSHLDARILYDNEVEETRDIKKTQTSNSSPNGSQTSPSFNLGLTHLSSVPSSSAS
jgi:hypothetical protein